LSQFNNLSPAGTWILKIYDRRTPDTGLLKAWSLTVVYEIPIGINQISIEIPEKFNLKQNYPNPFNPSTKIRFSIPKSALTKIIVYDILGKEIETLVNQQLNTGIYETNFNASNLSCRSGVNTILLVNRTYKSWKVQQT
jgi:subtilisin-like proprotein convertase family protein